MCCHLVRLKYQTYDHQPQLAREREIDVVSEPVHQHEAAFACLSAGLISELVPR